MRKRGQLVAKVKSGMQEDICDTGAEGDIKEKSKCRAAGEGEVIEGTRCLIGVFFKGEISEEGNAKYCLAEDKEDLGDGFLVRVAVLGKVDSEEGFLSEGRIFLAEGDGADNVEDVFLEGRISRAEGEENNERDFLEGEEPDVFSGKG